MAKTKEVIETPVSVNKAAEQSLQAVELRRRGLLKYYKEEKKMPVSIAPLYKPYFGESMVVSVNDISIVIPCDGKTYQVNKTHAEAALSRIAKVNLMIDRTNKMKDIPSNAESTPGEIKFF